MKLKPSRGRYFTNQDVLDLLIKNKPDLARNTNTGFMYCNTNFALLALIVEKVTKNKFPEAMRKMIFQPLKMEHSYIFQPKDSLKAAQSFITEAIRFSQMISSIGFMEIKIATLRREICTIFLKQCFLRNF